MWIMEVLRCGGLGVDILGSVSCDIYVMVPMQCVSVVVTLNKQYSL